jgi:hypothetical protein
MPLFALSLTLANSSSLKFTLNITAGGTSNALAKSIITLIYGLFLTPLSNSDIYPVATPDLFDNSRILYPLKYLK